MKKKFSSVFALFFFISINAQIGFQEYNITTNADNANTVFAADIDGDGDMDVLSSSANDDKISWYENTNGLGDFSSQQVISTAADNPYSVFAADIDGDGDIDVLSASGLDDKIAWYENMDGQGNFGVQQVITTNADNAYSVFAKDLDGDGDIDVLSTSTNDDKVAWYENLDGQGNFGVQQIITTNTNFVYSVFSDDLDGDGDMDVLSASPLDNKIAWYENTNGLGNFGSQQIISVNAINATKVYTADIDGDGDIDVLSSSVGDNKIAWYENLDGQGNFGTQQVITINANTARAVFAIDIDNDGDIDVLSASFGDDKIAWYENIDGQGSFGAQQVITTNADAAHSVFASDLNGDGKMDVLSASGYDDSVVWYENLGFQLIAYQPSNLVICDDNNDGFAIFDLTETEPEIIGGQDPTDLVINFYVSQSDADNAINIIVPPNSFINSTNPQTIYARLEDNSNGDFDITNFNLIVNNSPTPITPTALEACDQDNDGFAEFNLTDKDVEIIGGEPNVIVTYHETQSDAETGDNPLPSPYVNYVNPQVVYVRVVNTVTGCFTIVVLELIVLQSPVIVAVDDLIVFDENNDGIEIFDLTTKISEILDGQIDVEVSFYESQQDAETNINIIVNPSVYINMTNPQTIYTRLESLDPCYSVGSFVIFADPNLGVNDGLLNDLKIYPNPTTGIINLQNDNLIESIEVTIYNLQGQLLYKDNIVPNRGIVELNLSSISSGVYFIKATVDSNVVVKKVVKQ